MEVLEWFLPPILSLVMKRSTRCCHVSVLHMVASMLKTLSCAVDTFVPPPASDDMATFGLIVTLPVRASNRAGKTLTVRTTNERPALFAQDSSAELVTDTPKTFDDSELPAKLEAMIIFAMTWSIGAVLDKMGRIQFDAILRRLLAGLPLEELDFLPRNDVQRSSAFAAEVFGVRVEGGKPIMAQAVTRVGLTNLPTHLPSSPDVPASVFDFTLEVDGVVLGRGTDPTTEGLNATARSSYVKWVEWTPHTAGHPDSLSSFVIPPQTRFEDIIVPTPETVRVCRVISTLALHGLHVLGAGPTGTSKSAVMRHWLLNVLNDAAGGAGVGGAGPRTVTGGALFSPQSRAGTTGAPASALGFPSSVTSNKRLAFSAMPGKTTRGSQVELPGVQSDRKKYLSIALQLCARSSPGEVQSAIEGAVSRRRVGMYGPPMGKKLVVMVDDVHIPSQDAYGCQPTVELMRQWLDHRGWYDTRDKQKAFKKMYDVLMVGTLMTSSGNSADASSQFSGPVKVSQRFLRHFNVIAFLPYDNTSLQRIFDSVMAWHVPEPAAQVCGLR